MTPETRQTLELLISQERQRIQTELGDGGMLPQDLLEDAEVGWFQDEEPMTFEEYGNRLNNMEHELLSELGPNHTHPFGEANCTICHP